MAGIKHSLEHSLAFFKLIRYWQWADKLQAMIVALMCLLIFGYSPAGIFLDILVFIIYLILGFIAAYLINSYTDRSIDQKAGKDFLGHYSIGFVQVVFVCCTIGFAILPIYFGSTKILVLNAVIIFLGIFYSMPPLRLKERGFWGLWTATVAQRMSFLFFLFIVPDESTLVWYLFGWLLIIGFLIEMAHQIQDYQNDKDAKIRTFAQIIGLKGARACIYSATVIGLIYLSLVFVLPLMPQPMSSRILLWGILFLFSQHAVLYAYENIWQGFPLTSAHQFWKKGL